MTAALELSPIKVRFVLFYRGEGDSLVGGSAGSDWRWRCFSIINTVKADAAFFTRIMAWFLCLVSGPRAHRPFGDFPGSPDGHSDGA